MVTEDPVDLNLTMSPSSRKIPALLTLCTVMLDRELRRNDVDSGAPD